MNNIKFVFFGTSMFSVHVLNALLGMGFIPTTIVTFPDRPKGRKLIPSPNVVKTWAQVNNVPVIETLSLKQPETALKLKSLEADIFIVASFGRMLPAEIIYMPKYKTLNVHPSLLPKLRGPAPIQEAILSEEKTGVSIMRLDEGMDTGPLIAQKEVLFDTWPLYYKEAEEKLAIIGGNLLAEVLPKWIRGGINEIPQDNSQATTTRLVNRSDGDITGDDPLTAFKKVRAFEVWPRTFLFFQRKDGEKELLIIRKAEIINDQFVPTVVIPAGRREMSYEDYTRGN